MTVYKEVYEVVGAKTLAAARAFKAARIAAFDAQWKIARALGADGFRPGHGGGIKTLLFKADTGIPLPPGFKRIGSDRWRVECATVRNTKAGKEAGAKLAAAPKRENWSAFANTFDWKGRSPMSTASNGRVIIHFASGVEVGFPRERFFVTFPRELKDGWKPPKGIKLVRESDMLRAIEDHTAEVGRRDKRKKGASS